VASATKLGDSGMTSPTDYVVILSRLRFAITTLFHILWPVLTIGLSLFLVVTE
jgi:cytochrome bd ubiquinol oxidase subunit I